MKRPLLAILAAAEAALLMSGPGPIYAADSGVGSLPQGTQSDTDYSNSFLAAHVSNLFATTQKVSCYTAATAKMAAIGNRSLRLRIPGGGS